MGASTTPEALPRVLAFLTFDPWPIRSGTARRLEALLRALADVSELTVVIAVPEPSDELPAYPCRVVRIPRSRGGLRTVLSAMRHLHGLRPVTAALHDRAEVRETLTHVVGESAPDLVFTHGIAGLELVRRVAPLDRVVLDADTIDPLTFRRVAGDSKGFVRLLWGVDALLLPWWHRRWLARVEAVSVVSEHDRALYCRMAPRARFLVVPNGVDVPSQSSSGEATGPLLFLGTMHYPPNVSAVAWFGQSVLPLLPGTALRVVGVGPVPMSPGVDAVGFVPDVEPEWRQASALVVPLRAGGGTRLKVLEAMAHGLPIVSTQLGVEGLPAEADVHYLQAETAQKFAEQCRRLQTDEALRHRLSRAGRALTAAMTWEQCARPLVDLVRTW